MALAMSHKLQLDAFLFSFSSKYFYYPWDFLWTMDYLVMLFREFSSYCFYYWFDSAVVREHIQNDLNYFIFVEVCFYDPVYSLLV